MAAAALALAMMPGSGQAQNVLSEGFNGTSLPAGWTQEYVSGTINWATVTTNGNSTVSPHSGARMAEFRYASFSGQTTKLVTPSLDLSAMATAEITFYYANADWSGDVDELRMYYKTSAAGPWTLFGGNYTTAHSTWQQVTLSLPNLSGDYYIAFEGKTNYARGLNVDDVSVDGVPAIACAGQPDAGTAGGPAGVCSGTTAILEGTGLSVGLGLNYQWEESADGSTWVPVSGGSGATTTSYTTGPLTSATYFRVVTTCSNSGLGNESNAVFVQVVNSVGLCGAYCIPTYSTGCSSDYISNVTVAGINRSSACDGPHNLFSSPVGSLTVGDEGVSIAVTTGGDSENLVVWIDWNQDEVFSAAEAVLVSAKGGTPYTHTGTFDVPTGAATGQTRMRVRCSYSTPFNGTNACTAQTWGETEDYLINIIAATPCSSTPDAGNVVGPAMACDGQGFTLSLSNTFTEGGISYAWYARPVGDANFTLVGTTATLTTTQSVGTEYYCTVTCDAAGSDDSDVITVGMKSLAQCYCEPSTTGSVVDIAYITDFATTGGVTNVSNGGTGNSGYADYTGLSPHVSQYVGESVNFQIDLDGSDGDGGARIWIDWDQDGTFDEAEEVAYASTTWLAVHTGTITVPLDAVVGTTRMRVVCSWNYNNAGDAGPCTTDFEYGEYEDYLFEVLPCSGPEPTANASNDGPYCEGGLIELNVGTDVGTTFAWTGPNGFTSSAQNPSISAASAAHAGSYTVVVGTSLGNCVTVGSTTVEVNPNPINVSASASEGSVCAGMAVDLTGEGSVSVTPLFEDFNGAVTGWTLQNNSTGGTPAEAAWMLYLSGGTIASPDNSTFIGSNSDAQGSGGSTNTVLFSPVFSLANTTSASLTFNHYFRYISGSTGNVFVSTDAGANFTLVQSYTTTQGSGLAFAAANIDLSAYAGESSVMVAFQYLASWGYYWLIDDIQVNAQAPANFSWSSDPAGFTSTQQNPTGVVVNTATTYTLTVSTDAGCSVTDQVSVGVQAGNAMQVAITTDANPEEITWEIVDAASNVLATGGPYAGQSNTTIVEAVCMTDPQGEWYGFKVEDSGNDGITNGSWELRSVDGKLIMRDAFDLAASSSPIDPPHTASYGAYHTFALPIGAVDIHPDECGIMDNQADNKVYAVKQSGKNYQGATLNYQFEFLNPDSGRVRRTKKNRNYVLWSELTNPDLVAGVTYYARVRTDKFGVITGEHWGAGCEMAMGLPTACTGLIDDSNNQYYSCSVERRFRPNSQIFAWPVYGATKYKFRIYNLGEGYDQEFVSNNYKLELSWPVEVAPKLRNGYTYQVQVSALVNGVWTNYCSACPITINNNPSGHMVEVFGDATLWPNPARDGQVNLNIDGIASDVQHITVDVKDIYGQHVYGQEFGNMGDRFNTVLDLPGDIATGIYLVNITVNGEVTTKRLSIVR